MNKKFSVYIESGMFVTRTYSGKTIYKGDSKVEAERIRDEINKHINLVKE